MHNAANRLPMGTLPPDVKARHIARGAECMTGATIPRKVITIDMVAEESQYAHDGTYLNFLEDIGARNE